MSSNSLHSKRLQINAFSLREFVKSSQVLRNATCDASQTFVEGQMISVPSIANEKQGLGDNHSTKANKTVSQSRLKRWNHAAASDPEFNLLVVFGGYGPDVRGRVCRQNDVLVAWARPDEPTKSNNTNSRHRDRRITFSMMIGGN